MRSEDPTAGNSEKFYAILAEIIENLEGRVKETLNTTPEGRLGPQDGEHFYRLLGAYRAMSEALVDYADNASVINWRRWREERFS